MKISKYPSAVPAVPWGSRENFRCICTLASRYPFLRTAVAGRSAMGRALMSLSFGAGERAGIFTAAHHANEWITAPALLRHVEALAARCAAGEAPARSLYARTRLVFLPLVNPDGADLVNGMLAEGPQLDRAREIAAAYPAVPFPSGWKANIAGTDLNLQYPAGWEEAKRIKFAQGWTGPAPRDFVGPAPLRARESRALCRLTERLRPRAALALHTQGEVIYWQYRGYAPPGAQALAAGMAAASGYALDTVPDESANAGYKDWVIDALDAPAFTMECGLGESPLPLAQLEAISAAVEGACAALEAYIATA